MTRDRNATEERLIEAGFQTLAEGGFAGFGINGVARAAGCDKKLIYRYFGDLDGLLEAMGERVARDLGAALAPALEPRPATYAEMIERLAFALLDHQSADRRFRQLRAVELMSAAPAGARFQAARGRVMQAWMREARGDLVPPEGVDAAALNAVLIAAVEGLALSGATGLGSDAGPRTRAALLQLMRCGYAQAPVTD
ncbi:putative transcriptional regulator protein, TetR family [Rubellimicrobium mesophilum DSM 19309]|uniref:Putative transcriptional regulator protein, TetR family n=1 Tax=Rubellimicrobium mesophilum DSM 19309 TaxID=442562 RepID=A0A017HNP1_9RHOB|nr:TetR/AcrR family transcriptional regulator [Rubellimicrobium mesophilum]EYD76077.1 putative transcriptional regulator protein, TetR family [Rubellimicrobium mesophilum DSM 19309]